ncbi:MAG: nucleoside deaminase [Ignavibacteriaceae bacterium]|nr:MAG: nucleoside deaminase [Ignavibacteriaceae bacterium]MBW7872382.1 nucleoside deaminase [Ignavibacteria bacterium]MBZ0196776.1 tRNA adenosine(34) deaminase TadA [Ignavibacteriaceae bacterium]
MIFSENDYRFMYAALQEAQQAFDDEEVPVGCVIVHDERIIGRGYNQNIRLKDPTAHAEMVAITAAANHLGSERLEGCTVYSTLEPCLMCTGALLHARVKKIVFAAFDAKFGCCASVCNHAEDGKFNHKIEVFSGLMENESLNLLRSFFERLRN